MNMSAQSHVSFADTLSDRKLKVIHTNKGNAYKGIRLKVKVSERLSELFTYDDSSKGGLIGERVKVMKAFLDNYLNSFSREDLLKKPSQPSQPSLPKPPDNEKKPTLECEKVKVNLHSEETPQLPELHIQLEAYRKFYCEVNHTEINSTNIADFCKRFYTLNTPKTPDGSKYKLQNIQEIAAKLYKITPVVTT